MSDAALQLPKDPNMSAIAPGAQPSRPPDAELTLIDAAKALDASWTQKASTANAPRPEPAEDRSEEPQPAETAEPGEPPEEPEQAADDAEPEAEATDDAEEETEGKDAPEGYEDAGDDVLLIKANGEEHEVPLSEAIRAWQRIQGSDAEVRRKTEAAAKALDDANSQKEHYQAKIAETEQYEADAIKAAEDFLSNADYWKRLVEQAAATDQHYVRMSDDQLRAHGVDPATYRQQADERLRLYQNLERQVQDAREYAQRKRQRDMLGVKRLWETTLRTAWGDAHDERLGIALDYARAKGFSDDEIKTNGVHPEIAQMAWKAALYDRAQEQTPKSGANGKAKSEPGPELRPKVLRRKRKAAVSTQARKPSRDAAIIAASGSKQPVLEMARQLDAEWKAKRARN